MDSRSEQPRRFDHSFVVRMIRDFFLVLVAVILLELLIRFGLVIYRFQTEQPEEVAMAAERLAGNVRSIMLNRGGPVAARTVYPIIRRNHEEIGLQIAIEPSPVTVESIRKRFDETPEGIPAQWPEGRYQQAVRRIEAEPFCLQCHVTAGVGDVLGRVVVRSYLDRELEAWWREVRFSATLGMGKILAHTVILFVLLRARMEPLNSLKGVVAVLAKSGSGLTHRAPVISDDEFGELARDLNLFLERVRQVMEDLSALLADNSALAERLSDVQERSLASQRRLDELAAEAGQEARDEAASHPLMHPQWLETATAALRTLERLAAPARLPQPDADRLERLLQQFRELVDEGHAMVERNRNIGGRLVELNRELNVSREALQQMAILEERMQALSKQGQTLLARLHGSSGPGDEDRETRPPE